MDSIFDIYSDTSEISELNRLKKMECSEELAVFFTETEKLGDIYGYGTDISAGNLIRLWHDSLEKNKIPEYSDIEPFLETAGKKNFTVSGSLVSLENGVITDPGAASKGYILDLVYDRCVDRNSGYTIVSTGSTTLLYSRNSDYVFQCAVKLDSENIAGTAEVTSCFVSTSGDYERFTEIDGISYHHIIDMNTGYPADSGLSSVTVFCDSGIKSDFLSTLIFTQGKDNIDKYLNSDEFRIVAIDKQGNIYKSNSLVFHENKKQSSERGK